MTGAASFLVANQLVGSDDLGFAGMTDLSAEAREKVLALKGTMIASVIYCPVALRKTSV